MCMQTPVPSLTLYIVPDYYQEKLLRYGIHALTLTYTHIYIYSHIYKGPYTHSHTLMHTHSQHIYILSYIFAYCHTYILSFLLSHTHTHTCTLFSDPSSQGQCPPSLWVPIFQGLSQILYAWLEPKMPKTKEFSHQAVLFWGLARLCSGTVYSTWVSCIQGNPLPAVTVSAFTFKESDYGTVGILRP